MFNPLILKLAKGMSIEVIWVEDYASYTIVPQFLSLKLVNKLPDFNSTDAGNCSVTVLLLILLRMK